MSKRSMPCIPWLFTLLFCASGPPAAAEVYKWTDAEGRVHFGDRPPQSGADAVPLSRKAQSISAPTADERLDKQRRLLHAFEEERRQRRDAQAQAQQEKTTRQRNCVEARDDLRSQEVAGALYRLGADGQRIYLDAAERARALEETRAAVRHWCGAP
jgi:hypothetical protein